MLFDLGPMASRGARATQRLAEKAGWVNQNAGVLILDKDANDEVSSSLKIGRYETNPYSGNALIGDPDVAMSLVSLGELGITSINLANTLIANPAAQGDGNIKVRSGSLSFADGSTREVAEYRLVRDESDTRFTQWREETPEITALPELKLGGRVMDLHQALIRDAEEGYNGHTQGALKAALDAYLQANAQKTVGVSGSGGNQSAADANPSPAISSGTTGLSNGITHRQKGKKTSKMADLASLYKSHGLVSGQLVYVKFASLNARINASTRPIHCEYQKRAPKSYATLWSVKRSSLANSTWEVTCI